jgi:putative oxidoreductase
MANSSGNDIVSLVGRVLISVIFIFAGTNKLLAFKVFAGMLASKGFPRATVAMAVAVVIEVLGGLAILFGFQTKVVAWIIFLYLIPTTLMFHNFWANAGHGAHGQPGPFSEEPGDHGRVSGAGCQRRRPLFAGRAFEQGLGRGTFVGCSV